MKNNAPSAAEAPQRSLLERLFGKQPKGLNQSIVSTLAGELGDLAADAALEAIGPLGAPLRYLKKMKEIFEKAKTKAEKAEAREIFTEIHKGRGNQRWLVATALIPRIKDMLGISDADAASEKPVAAQEQEAEPAPATETDFTLEWINQSIEEIEEVIEEEEIKREAPEWTAEKAKAELAELRGETKTVAKELQESVEPEAARVKNRLQQLKVTNSWLSVGDPDVGGTCYIRELENGGRMVDFRTNHPWQRQEENVQNRLTLKLSPDGKLRVAAGGEDQLRPFKPEDAKRIDAVFDQIAEKQAKTDPLSPAARERVDSFARRVRASLRDGRLNYSSATRDLKQILAECLRETLQDTGETNAENGAPIRTSPLTRFILPNDMRVELENVGIADNKVSEHVTGTVRIVTPAAEGRPEDVLVLNMASSISTYTTKNGRKQESYEYEPETLENGRYLNEALALLPEAIERAKLAGTEQATENQRVPKDGDRAYSMFGGVRFEGILTNVYRRPHDGCYTARLVPPEGKRWKQNTYANFDGGVGSDETIVWDDKQGMFFAPVNWD
jgi:hypothetical protein